MCMCTCVRGITPTCVTGITPQLPTMGPCDKIYLLQRKSSKHGKDLGKTTGWSLCFPLFLRLFSLQLSLTHTHMHTHWFANVRARAISSSLALALSLFPSLLEARSIQFTFENTLNSLTHTCVLSLRQAHTRICTFTFTYPLGAHTPKHTHSHKCTHMLTHTRTHTHTHTHTHTRTHMHTHAHLHTHTRTHTYTHGNQQDPYTRMFFLAVSLSGALCLT
jgi:hypothetical protein